MLGYNRMTGYNKARYNAEGTEIQKADTITVTDDTVTKAIASLLVDLIVLADSQAKQQNKSVSDSIRLNDWTRYKEQQADQWGD